MTKTKKDVIPKPTQGISPPQNFPGTSIPMPSAFNPNSMVLPQQVVNNPVKGNVPSGTIEQIRSGETGNVSGATVGGKTYLGLNYNDVNMLAKTEANKTAMPSNAMPAGTAQAQATQTANMQQMQQIGEQSMLTPQQLQDIQGASPDVGQAIGAGAVQGALAGGVAGAGIGAAAGFGIATPVTAPIGAVIGAIAGFINGVRTSVKSQQTDQFAIDQNALTKGQTMLRSLITDTNQNPQNAPENIALFYQTLNMIDAAHAKTKKDSSENLNKWLGADGSEQLAKFETFDNAMRLYYINRFNTALQMPDPSQNMITAEDLGI